MELFLKYSGFYIIFFSWIFMVAPFLILRKRYHLNTISDTVSITKAKFIVNSGIFGAALSQILFVYYLLTRLNLFRPEVGAAFFVIGSISFAMASYFNIVKFPQVHHRLVKVYFTSMAIGSTLMSLSFIKLSIIAEYLCLSVILLMYIGTGILYRKKMYGEAEIWTIVFSTLWALIIYRFIY